jgi:hypothetical protein
MRVRRAVSASRQFRRVDQVGLRQQDLVGETHLALGFLVLVQLRHAVARIDHRDHGVKQ